MQLFIMMQVLHIKLSGVGCCSDYTRKPDFNITLATIFILRKDIVVGGRYCKRFFILVGHEITYASI